MKTYFLLSAVLPFLILSIAPPAKGFGNPDHIDPCALIAKEK